MTHFTLDKLSSNLWRKVKACNWDETQTIREISFAGTMMWQGTKWTPNIDREVYLMVTADSVPKSSDFCIFFIESLI